MGNTVKTWLNLPGKIGSAITGQSSAPKATTLPTLSTQSGTYIYDAEGKLIGSVVKDANGNTIYKPGSFTAEEMANKTAAEQRKQEIMNRLYKTPEEYTRAATEEAEAYAAPTLSKLDKDYQKQVNLIGETMNTRGLMGSKAYADILKDVGTARSEAVSNVGLQTTAMRDKLLNQKINRDYNMYSLYSDYLDKINNKNTTGYSMASGLYGTQANIDINRYNSTVNALTQDYQNKLSRWSATEPWRNYIMPTLTSAAYIYGSSKK